MLMVESIKIVLLGESGVGKSSIALRFVTDEFRPYTEATIGASFMSKQITIPLSSSTTTSGVQTTAGHDNDDSTNNKEESTQQQQMRNIGFKIWDTAGQEKYRSLAPMYYRGSSAAILVYDITKPASFAALQDWAKELQHNGPPNLKLAVCGNKRDLASDRLVGKSTGQAYADKIGAMYIETSAKAGEGIESLFVELAKRIPPPENMGEEGLEEDVGLDLGKAEDSKGGCC